MPVKKVIQTNPDMPTLALNQPRRRRLPRGASSLPRDVVELEQRKRIVLGAARVVAEQGYAKASVAQIIAQAGVSRATFYNLFRDKEQCFLYGFTKLSNAHLAEVEREITGSGPLPERLVRAITAYLGRINIDHHFARAYIAEAQAATPALRAAFDQAQRKLQRFLQIWLDQVRQENPEVSAPTGTDISLVMNGLNGHIMTQVRAGEPFSDQHIMTMCRYLFAALGMFEWARHVSPECQPAAQNSITTP